MASKPVKKEKTVLNPEWLSRTAKLAMKRGTAIVFGKSGCVYGILPNQGGSANIFYEPDQEWVDAVLSIFPDGAVFPFDNVFGGPAAAKALRAYANVKLPENGSGTAWIDGVTHTLHVKGHGTTIHSATFEANNNPEPPAPEEILSLSFAEGLPKDIGKLMAQFTKRDDNRPFLRRMYALHNNSGSFLGASDSRSAIIHEMSGLPEGFSIDPTLVNLYDIVGYHREDTEGGAIIHNFKLSDGSLYVEKINPTETPRIADVVLGVADRSRKVLLTGMSLRQMEEDIAQLGLGANDSFGGVIVLSSAGTSMLANWQPVAEFDVSANMEPGETMRFALPILSRIAKLGGDMQVTDDGGDIVAYCEAAATRMVVMPLKMLNPAAGAAT